MEVNFMGSKNFILHNSYEYFVQIVLNRLQIVIGNCVKNVM